MKMTHYERKRWVHEIAKINKQINNNIEKQIVAQNNAITNNQNTEGFNF